MQTRENLELLFQRYFSNECTAEELATLEAALKDRRNHRLFKEYADAHQFSVDALHLGEKAAHIKKRKDLIYKFTIAASLALIAVLSFLLMHKPLEKKSLANAAIEIDGGTKKTFNSLENQIIKNEKNETIAKIENRKLSFINIPSSKQIKISVNPGAKLAVLLPDHTEIDMNSSSELVFTDSFENEKVRRVYLNGEAFFSVAKDASKPFFVETEQFTTKVLGTKFNINSYNTDQRNTIFLVEGSIAVNHHDNKKEKLILKPGEGISINKKAKLMQKENNPKKEDETAWLQDEVVFHNETMEEIFVKIERIYGVKIINKNPEMNEVKFSGRFKNDSIENIMQTIKISVGCDYTMKNKTITIL